MVRCLRRWNGRTVSLKIGNDVYHEGTIQVEKLSSRERKGAYTRTAERRYYYETSSGERIRIYHHGNNRVVEKEGRLVKLMNETRLD